MFVHSLWSQTKKISALKTLMYWITGHSPLLMFARLECTCAFRAVTTTKTKTKHTHQSNKKKLSPPGCPSLDCVTSFFVFFLQVFIVKYNVEY